MPYNSIHTGEDIDAGISKTQGVASNATANATDAQLRDRGTHTGTQPLSSISDAGSAATASTEDFATAAQGSLADTAQQPPTEGAFVDGDKTKLDNIEASADVTDTANVTSAGALMDSEVTNLAQVKSFDSSDYAPAAHTQAISTVTGLQGALDGKLVSGSNISLLTNDSGFTTNTALSAIATNNAGSSEPNPTFAHMLWFDTNNDLMKVRNEANSAWVIVAKKDGSGWTPYRQGTALGTASVQPDNRYAHRSNNLSDLGSAATARANLGVAEDSSDADFTNDPNAAARRGLVLSALNATGSAPMYACRAWVNFDGTGTVSIRASGNVSSITDNGVGDYTVNFATNMPDVNYAVAGTVDARAGANGFIQKTATGTHPNLVGSCRVSAINALSYTSVYDPAQVCLAIFR